MTKRPFTRRLTAALSVVATAAGLGLALPSAAHAEAAAAAIGCTTVPIFETDGRGATATGANWNAFNTRVPAGYAAQKVLYKDGVFPLVDANPLDVAVADGVAKLDAAVRGYHAACPNSRIILAGYSEGAVVAGNEIENLSRTNAIPHNLINGVLYGDPRRPFGPGGVGGTAGGIETNLPTLLPQVTMQGPHAFGDIAVREVCHENDGICNSTNLITNALAFANGIQGFLSGWHNYDLNPVRDQGSGLDFRTDPQLIAYGPPLATGVGTPWQVQQALFGADMRGPVRSAMNTVNSVLPADVQAALADNPWYQLANSA